MVAKLSEQEARETLAEFGSPAADPAKYAARRIGGGWLFNWRADAGPPLLGTIGWVVADNGRCTGKTFRMRADEVVQSLMQADP